MFLKRRKTYRIDFLLYGIYRLEYMLNNFKKVHTITKILTCEHPCTYTNEETHTYISIYTEHAKTFLHVYVDTETTEAHLHIYIYMLRK